MLVLLLVGTLTWRWREALWTLARDQTRLREWIATLGFWGPLVSIGLNTAQVLLAPIPGHFVGILNGYLYGPWLGTLYSMAGLLLGTILAMGLARRYGRPLVERFVDEETLQRWDRLAARQGPWFFFLIYLIPSLPDDLICFVIGLSQIKLPMMVTLAMIGRLPGVFVSCWVGAYANSLPWWMWIPMGGGAALLAWLMWRYQAHIERFLVRLIQILLRRGAAKRVNGEHQPADQH
jgi:uncharacterized membrane protein YdjX (TVP38/TMEM64 family)